MRYNRATNEWVGPLASRDDPEPRFVHVDNHLYWTTYHDTLKEPGTPAYRGRKLRAMTKAGFWADEATIREQDLGMISPEVYISPSEE
jgi:hypothetical protein